MKFITISLLKNLAAKKRKLGKYKHNSTLWTKNWSKWSEKPLKGPKTGQRDPKTGKSGLYFDKWDLTNWYKWPENWC